MTSARELIDAALLDKDKGFDGDLNKLAEQSEVSIASIKRVMDGSVRTRRPTVIRLADALGIDRARLWESVSDANERSAA